MPYRVRFSYFLMMFFLLSCLGVSVAVACICARGSFKTRWQEADVIFHGTVKEIAIDHPRYLNVYDDKPAAVTFDVAGYFKGRNGKMTEISPEISKAARGHHIVPEEDEDKIFTMHTSLQHVTCMGYPFKEGEDYLVFAYLREEGSGNRWSLYHYPAGSYGAGGLCGGTVPYDTPEARRDLKDLYKILGSGSRSGRLIKFPLND